MPQFRYDQSCPLARAAEILGERWTLLILRGLTVGPKRFVDLRGQLPGISSSVLSSRLESLEARNIIERFESPPPAPAALFRLTPLGEGLAPVLRELVRWGINLMQSEPSGPFIPEASLMLLECFSKREPCPELRIELEIVIDQVLAPVSIRANHDGVSIDRSRPALPLDTQRRARSNETVVRIDSGLLAALMRGHVSPVEAITAGASVEGDMEAFEALPSLFDLKETFAAAQKLDLAAPRSTSAPEQQGESQ